MPSRCPSPFPISSRRSRPGAGRRQYRRRGARRSGALRPVQAARSQVLCRADHQHQCGAQFRQLARDQCARPGDRPGARCSPTAGCASISASGTSLAKARCWACNSSPSRRTGGASPIWCRTRSMSASPARRAISTPASSSFRRSGPAIKRVKRLAVMDEDGANPIFLTRGDYLVLTPRFNPTAQMIAYMSYIGAKPRVYLFDLETGRQEMLGNFPNMTFSPALLAGRQQGGADAGERRQFRHLCDGSAHPRHHSGSPPIRRSTPRRPSRPTARRSRSNPTAAAASRSM